MNPNSDSDSDSNQQPPPGTWSEQDDRKLLEAFAVYLAGLKIGLISLNNYDFGIDTQWAIGQFLTSRRKARTWK